MAYTKPTYSKDIKTPVFELSFFKLGRPEEKVDKDGNKYKEYSLTMIFPGNTDLAKAHGSSGESILSGVNHVIKEHFDGNKTGLMLPIKKGSSPMKDGTPRDEKYPEMKDSIVISAKTNSEPVFLDSEGKRCSPDIFYRGALCQASITAKSYTMPGNKGVSFALSVLQFVAPGTKRSGGQVNISDFTAVSKTDSGSESIDDLMS